MNETLETIILIAIYLLIGWPIIYKALRNVLRGELFDENFLMVVATFGAIALGEYGEAVMVMLLYRIGEFLQDKAIERSRKAVEELGERSSHQAAEGLGSALTASETHGSGHEAESGQASGHEDSHSHAHGAHGHDHDHSHEARTGADAEKFITRFARVYTPIVCALAVLYAVLPPLLKLGSWSDCLYRACTLLIISCPCALVISIPLGFFAGIGGAASKGILIRSGGELEALAKENSSALEGLVVKGDAAELKPLAVSVSKKTMKIIYENIGLSLGIKAVVLLLTALGFTNMWLAVFADEGVCLLAILNAMRARIVK